MRVDNEQGNGYEKEAVAGLFASLSLERYHGRILSRTAQGVKTYAVNQTARSE